MTTPETARTTVVMLYPGHSAEDEYATLDRHLSGVHFLVVHTWRVRPSTT